VLAVGVEGVSHGIAEAPRIGHVKGPPCRQAGKQAGVVGKRAKKMSSTIAGPQPAGMLCNVPGNVYWRLWSPVKHGCCWAGQAGKKTHQCPPSRMG
jgi:hypothetical protein